MGETREPGWYADPWGTEDERYFDGSAWTRQVRPPGQPGVAGQPGKAQVDAARADVFVPAGGSSDAPSVREATIEPPRTGPPAGAMPPAAGWHTDPWREATWRWWDGNQWTGYTDKTTPRSSGAAVAAELATERTWARWARIGLTVNPIFQVLALVGASIQWRWIAGHWDEVVNGTSTAPTNATIFSYFGLPTLGVIVLLILWLYRAGATARAAGLPLRRDPGLGAVSFIIPILQLWWPYRAARDAVGPDPRAQNLVVRWWTAWIASAVGGLIVFGAAFLPEIFSFVAVALVAAISVVAALTGRAVVNAMLATHESLANQPA
ncbi:MAG: DUF2510 domain-containing protein [Acidimicrobiia bacterium]